MVTTNSDGVVAGVLVYYIPNINKSLAVGFSVFYNVNLWKVKTYNGVEHGSETKYMELLFASSIASDGWNYVTLDSLKCNVFMSTSAQAALDIKVYPSN